MNIRSLLPGTGTLWFAASFNALSAAITLPELKPLLAQSDKVVLQDDFLAPGPLKKEHWGPHQGTRWSIADGVLRGIPSNRRGAGFQA